MLTGIANVPTTAKEIQAFLKAKYGQEYENFEKIIRAKDKTEAQSMFNECTRGKTKEEKERILKQLQEFRGERCSLYKNGTKVAAAKEAEAAAKQEAARIRKETAAKKEAALKGEIEKIDSQLEKDQKEIEALEKFLVTTQQQIDAAKHERALILSQATKTVADQLQHMTLSSSGQKSRLI